MDSRLYDTMQNLVRKVDDDSKKQETLVQEFLNKLEERVNKLADQDKKVCEWGIVGTDGSFTAHALQGRYPDVAFSLQISFFDTWGKAIFRQVVPCRAEFEEEWVRVQVAGDFTSVPRSECCGMMALKNIADLLDAPLKEAVLVHSEPDE